MNTAPVQARLRWKVAWVPIVVIGLLGVVVYSNTWQSPFVFDDVHSIVEDRARRTLDWSLPSWFGTRALPYKTFDLNYNFGQLNVVHYHVVNIAIHVVTSWAVFWLGYLLSTLAHKTRVLAIGPWRFTNHLAFGVLAGLLFVSHPLQTQAVTYVVQRLASMAALFYITSLLGYVLFRLSREKWQMWTWGSVSIVAALAAMHSKEIAVTLPVAVVLLELAFFTSSWRGFFKRWRLLLPWLVLILVIPAYMLEVRDVFFHESVGPPESYDDTVFDKVGSVRRIGSVSAETGDISRSVYLLTQINVVRTYERLVVWPTGQNLDHDYPLAVTLFTWPTVLSLLLHLGLLAVAVWLFTKRRRIAAFGIYFFYLALSVESSLVPIKDVMFEHRVYLPMLGYVLLVGDMGEWLARKWRPAVVLGLAVLLVATLSVASWRRNAVWADEVTLWTDAVAKSPNKARPRNNLGKAYLSRQEFDLARENYLRELEIDPDSVSAHNNLGSVYGLQGEFDKAIAEINKALELRPDHDGAFNNLGNVYQLQEKYEEAERAYRASLELNQQDGGVYRNLAEVLTMQQKYEQAVLAWQEALLLVPGEAAWRNKLGVVLGVLGRFEEAEGEFKDALESDPQLAVAYGNLGNVLKQQGQLDEAAQAYMNYLRLRPGDEAMLEQLRSVLSQ